MVPTVFSFVGLANIQPRGEWVSQDELDREHPFTHELAGLDPEAYHDLTKAENFCRIDGKIRLADYGSDETFAYLYREPRPVAVLA